MMNYVSLLQVISLKMFPVMASEPKMDVSNVQSCSHEKELFVLLVQTDEKLGRSVHLLGCMCTMYS